jgi:hypothetical protein
MPEFSVFRCNHSGVIYLSRSDHVEMRHYEEQTGSQYWDAPNRAQAIVALDEAYAQMLSGLDMTDTLVAFAEP